MSCNTFIPIMDLVREVEALLAANYIDKDDPRITGGVFTNPTIKEGFLLDVQAREEFCRLVQECGLDAPFGKMWLSRPLYPDQMFVSYEDSGEPQTKWKTIQAVLESAGVFGPAATSLSSRLAAEIDRATAAESGIISRAEAADASIAANKTSIATNTSAISAENNRATAAEGVLTTEVAALKLTDASLQAQVNSIGGGKKAYTTYALMDADRENIAANSSIDVVNDPDPLKNGTYGYDGAEFTKSIYDPLTLAKADATTKADAAEANAKVSSKYYTDKIASLKTDKDVVSQVGAGNIAVSFVSSDDKDLGHINSDGGFVLSGERETLQEQVEYVPRKRGNSNIAYNFGDENEQSLLSIREDGGLLLAGDDTSLQDYLAVQEELTKNRLGFILSAQGADARQTLFKAVVRNDDVQPLKIKTRLSTATVSPNREFNRMPAVIKTPTGLLLMYCKRIFPYDGDRQGANLMQRIVTINDKYEVTEISDATVIENPSVPTGLVKHQMLGRAPNGNIVMMYDVREDEDVNYRQYVRISSDNGVSWSAPVEFSQNPLLEGRSAANSATGTMVTLDSGRMLVPLYSPNRIWFAYSDDNGVTWNHGAIAGTEEIPNDTNYNLSESAATVDANGDLLLSVRLDNREIKYKLLYKSTDEGLTIQFYREALELVSTFCASAIYYDSENGLMLHGTPSFVEVRARKDYNIQVSADNGASFPISYKPFDPEWYVGYSQIIKYAKDTYMCVFEGDEVYTGSNATENIAILTFNIKEVLNNVRYSKI